jgi:1-deoxy-D-xylulose-5-phosphate synthase
VADNLFKKANDNDKLVFITPAMSVGSKFGALEKKYPERFFDVGIAEGHAITFGAGIALGGKLPVASIYSTFLQRAYDNLNHDLSRPDLPALIFVDRCGVVGSDGETHQGHYDVELELSLPNKIIAMPLDIADANSMLDLALNSHKLFFFRIPREFYFPKYELGIINSKIGEFTLLNEGKKEIVIISTGPVSVQIDLLIKEKYPNITLIFARYYYPIDAKLILQYASKAKTLIVYDIYATKSALATQIESLLFENKISLRFKSFNLPNANIEHGNIQQVLDELKVSIKYLEKYISEVINVTTINN